MHKKTCFILLISTFALYTSCENKNTNPILQTQFSKKDFISDIEDASLEYILYFNIKLDSSILIIPLDGCNSCITKSVRLARKHINKMNVIIMGNISQTAIINKSDREYLLSKKNVYIDSNSNYKNYFLDIYGPILINKYNSRVIKIVLDSQNISIIDSLFL